MHNKDVLLRPEHLKRPMAPDTVQEGSVYVTHGSEDAVDCRLCQLEQDLLYKVC